MLRNGKLTRFNELWESCFLVAAPGSLALFVSLALPFSLALDCPHWLLFYSASRATLLQQQQQPQHDRRACCKCFIYLFRSLALFLFFFSCCCCCCTCSRCCCCCTLERGLVNELSNVPKPATLSWTQRLKFVLNLMSAVASTRATRDSHHTLSSAAAACVDVDVDVAVRAAQAHDRTDRAATSTPTATATASATSDKRSAAATATATSVSARRKCQKIQKKKNKVCAHVCKSHVYTHTHTLERRVCA